MEGTMKNNIVRKSNVLVEASYKLSTQEQRVILFLASLLKPGDEDFKDYSISVNEFSKLVGVNNKGKYKDIREITKKLISRVFTIHSNGEELQISWLSSAKYISGQGVVILSFDQKLKPYLLQLKSHFTTYKLYQVMQLKSSFSIRIYELLKQYQKLGTRVFEMKELREKLGIEPGQYKNFNDFKRFVILAAQEELAAKTDLAFDYEEIKVGRGVGKIRFIIKSQAQQPCLPEFPLELENVEDPQMNKLLDIVPSLFRDRKSIKTIIQTTFASKGFDYVMRNIIYSNDRSNALKPGTDSEKGSNYRVYLAKALNDDYGLAYYEDQLVKKEVAQVKQKTLAEAEQQKQRENHKIDQERENRERARIFIASYAPETMQAYEEEAKKLMSPESLARYLRKDPIGNFEFKRRLEDIVMKHTGIRKPQPETASESPENKPAGLEKEAAAE